MRRNAAQEVPLFTQDLGDYDILLVADEANDFARYIPFNTWRPRPVAGSEGLTAHAWDRVVEQWGAAQLQSRFEDLASRPMQDVDYAAWAALRTLGEAVTRTKSADPAQLRGYILGPDFELAGFKGRPQTFRTWNGQLRQPMPLTHRGALVAQAPLEGFLHQRTELDTLGLDQPESGCTAFD
jgi:ABC transporter substrate binding protein (PQQ-dependent alcohol dehydrogenase system)